MDKTLYLMQHLCRALASCQRFCEFLYIGGPPNTGKDVIGSLLNSLFGDISSHGWGCSTVPKDHFCVTGARASAKGTNTSIEASMAPARIVVIPEIPEKPLTMEELRDRVEQGGTPPPADGPCVASGGVTFWM